MATGWTNGDLAVLTTKAMELCVEDDSNYCEGCLVIPIQDGEKYCLGCTGDVTEYLAVRFAEQSLADRGLY